MSLFERIQNKRYDLQEAPIDDKGNITPEPGEIKKSKKILKKYNKKQKKDKLSDQEISRRRSAQTTRGDAINRSMGTSGSTEGAGGASGSKTVNQADVSKDAKKFTNKINKQRIEKQGNIFGGQDKIETKRNTSRGTRTVKKKFNTPGQQKLDLGDVTKKTPTPRLSTSGEVVTDLRTVKKKTRRTRKPVKPISQLKKEPMVTVKDPIKGGFRQVGATTKQGREVLKKKQFVSTDELLGNQNKIEKEIAKNNKKIKTPKTNLFSKVKSKLKGFHNYMVKDAGFRKTASKNLTRNTFKNTLRGNTLRNINKVLPGKYKALAAIATGAYLATRGKKKNTSGGVTGGDTKYTGVNPGLKLDTGKKNT